MASLQEIIEYSKSNPNTEYARKAYENIKKGKWDDKAREEGVDLSFAGRPDFSAVDEDEERIDRTARIAQLRAEAQAAAAKAEDIASPLGQFKEFGKELGEISGISPVARKTGIAGAASEFGTGVKEAFKERTEAAAEEQVRATTEDPEISMRRATLRTLGQGAGFVGDVGFEGLKFLAPKFIEDLASKGAEKLGETEIAQQAIEKLSAFQEKHPEASKDLEAVINLSSIIPIAKGTQVGIKKTLDVAKEIPIRNIDQAKEKVNELLTTLRKPKPDTPGAPAKPTGRLAEPLVANINRINPSKRQEFAQQQGQPMERWLLDRGIVGSRENTITELATRFQLVRKNVDEALEAIPGNYRDPRITTVADEAAGVAKAIESPQAQRVVELADKAKGEGLTTAEINEVKRFYERHIKVGYKKDPTKTAEQVQRATNRDSRIREALFDIADKNGFDNLRQLNKEIQASKFLADEIAGKMEGQAANNLMTLTDWVAITPGTVNPAFLAGFVTKKVLSTEAVRGFAARVLAGFPKTKPIPRADLAEIQKRATEVLKKQEGIRQETEKAALLADELKKAGFTMSEGTNAFITENPIPLSRHEQALIRAAENRQKQQQMVEYILEQRAQGKAVGEGFTIEDIDNVPILNPRATPDQTPIVDIDEGKAPSVQGLNLKGEDVRQKKGNLPGEAGEAFGVAAGIQVNEDGEIVFAPGMAALGLFGGAVSAKLAFKKPNVKNVITKIDNRDRNIMNDWVDTVRTQKRPSGELAGDAQQLAETMGLNADKLGNAQIADFFDMVLQADRARNKKRFGL